MQAINQNPLETLRADLRASFESQKVRETLPLRGVPSGIHKGAITEVSGAAGSGRTELVLQFLAQNPALRAAWIEDGLSIYPCAFPQHGVDLKRVLFIETDQEANSLWCAYQLLTSQIFEVVILGARIEEELSLKRLQLSAEKSGASLILLADEPRRQGTWPIALQLQVSRTQMYEPSGTWNVHILKNRGGSVWQSTG